MITPLFLFSYYLIDYSYAFLTQKHERNQSFTIRFSPFHFATNKIVYQKSTDTLLTLSDSPIEHFQLQCSSPL